MAGEITTPANVDYGRVARETIRAIGYNDPELRFDADGCAVMVCYGKQSPDIKRGVDQASDDYLNQGAGDQGLMFGYACDETPSLMPFPIYYAHRLVQRQSEVRRDGRLTFLRPGRQVAGHRALRRRQAARRRHGGALHAAPSVDEREAGRARRSGDRGDHQAGVPGEHAEGHALPRQSHRPLRDRRPARRRRRSPAARSSSTPTAARHRTAAAPSRARTRRRSTARPRTRRATWRRTSWPRASRANARCRSRTRSASRGR